ncbi:MAG: hypothetical protein K2Z81_06330 [Cyanobacteria bacterium]|nr:hypothetical protein [Cyanobacteriota bacterium]
MAKLLFNERKLDEAWLYVAEEYNVLRKMGDDYPGLDYDYFWLGGNV